MEPKGYEIKAEARPWAEPRKLRSPRSSLGSFGVAILVGGSVLALAILGFLFFLWLAGGSGGGANAPSFWRWVVLNHTVIQAITLSSAVLRIILAGQALIGTSLIAAILLERNGVPLVHVAEISLLRGVSSGPWRLVSLMFSSKPFLWLAKLPFCLALALSVTAIASQFASTILVSDLDTISLVGDDTLTSMGMDVDLGGAKMIQAAGLDFTPYFVPFGEVSGPANTTTPSSQGLSDTGHVQRVLLPMPEATRVTLRSYQGKAFVLTTRNVCLRPSITGTIHLASSAGSISPVLSGNISFPDTFSESGSSSSLPPDCASGSCFAAAAAFNCSLGFASATSPDSSLSAVSLCYPNRMNTMATPTSNNPGSRPIEAFSEVVLVVESSLTSDILNTILQQGGSLSLPADSTGRGEFTSWDLGRVPASVSATLCFQQIGFDSADVRLTSDRDLQAATVRWDQSQKTWVTNGPANMLGLVNDTASSISRRGIYKVEKATNFNQTNVATVIRQNIISAGTQDMGAANIGILMSPNAVGFGMNSPNLQTQAVFISTLNLTSRPAIALQNLATIMATHNLAVLQPQMAMTADATMTTSANVLAPQRLRGLIIVTALVATSISCVAVTALLFVARTKYSRVGDCWRAIAQVSSDETQWILDESTEYDDAAVATMLKSQGEVTVQVARSYGGLSRVQVMPYRRIMSDK